MILSMIQIIICKLINLWTCHMVVNSLPRNILAIQLFFMTVLFHTFFQDALILHDLKIENIRHTLFQQVKVKTVFKLLTAS